MPPDTNLPGPGHNSAGAAQEIDLSALLDPVTLRNQWEMDYHAGIRRRDELLENVKALKEKFKDGLQSEADVGRVSDIAKQLRDEAKIPTNLHEPMKKPFLDAGRAADAFFMHEWAHRLLESLPYFYGDGTRGAPLGIVTAFQRKQAQEERERREAEAKRLRDEAAAAAAAAQRAMTSDVVDNAIQLDQQAQQAQQAAKAPVTDLTRTRGAFGSVTSLQDNWVFEVEDLMALVKAVAEGKAPLHYLCLNEKIVGTLVKPKKGGVREIPGLKIWNAAKSGGR